MQYSTQGRLSRADSFFTSSGDILALGSRAQGAVNLRMRWGINREESGELGVGYAGSEYGFSKGAKVSAIPSFDFATHPRSVATTLK